MRRRTLQVLVALLIAGIWGASLAIGHLRGDSGLLGRLEATMTDLRTLARGERAAPELLTIVAVDDEAVRKAGSYPLRRNILAEIIETIAQEQPRVIAVDLLLVDRGTDTGDQALARSFARRPTVIAAAAIFPQARQTIQTKDADPLARLPNAERFLLPLDMFSAHAAIGVVNVASDQSGTPNAIPMLFRSGDTVEMSFALRVAALASGGEPVIESDRLTLKGRPVATDLDHVLPITFYGRRGTIRTISAAQVLRGEIPPDAFRDRIVVIGATVTGGGDFFSSPFDPVMPGVEVIATAIAHLMLGDGIRRDRSVRIADAVQAIVLPILLVGLLAWRRSAVGLIASLAVLLIWLGANVAAFSQGIWLSAALPIAAAAPPALLFGALQLWSGRQRAQHYASRSALFQQFQAPAVREWLTRDAQFLLEPVRQNATIVFIDLSGFTAMSETMGADAVRELLKDFHALVDSEVAAHGGVITSFLGDGAMILFGLPQADPTDAARAALCCVGLCRRTEDWLASLPPSIAARIGFKIGAHCGEIVASRLGGESYQHITATGDTVNVASRPMEVAARHGAELALSDDMLREAGRGDLANAGVLTGPIDAQIRGRSGMLAVWLWRNHDSSTERISAQPS